MNASEFAFRRPFLRSLSAIVLAGGASVRYGSDKTRSRWGGRSLVAHVALGLRELVDDVIVVTRRPESLRGLRRTGLRLVKDRFADLHPMGGLATGLSVMRHRAAFVCAADMPLIEPGLIALLGEAASGYDAAVPVWRGRRPWTRRGARSATSTPRPTGPGCRSWAAGRDMPVDPWGRQVDYLRLSVTDRCNFRCAYCLPPSFAGFAPSEELLSDQELVRVVSVFAALGFRRLRITGGEPLVRPGLPALVSEFSRLPGLSDLSLSTNGSLLAGLAVPLARAGLKRVNVSMDTLDPARFHSITRSGRLDDAWAGVEAALAAGLSPVKLNVVVARGFNEGEVPDFVALTRTRPLHVRFIELMPMGEAGFFCEERRVPFEELLRRAGPLEAVGPGAAPEGAGPARVYRSPGALGTVGFITAMSCGFCGSCNRLRLTAGGMLHPCLDDSEGVDLREPLRAGAADGELRALVAWALSRKPEGHRMLERAAGRTAAPRFMCQTGG
ncbi:MAG: GTP 3',8-cyclase MoaA [Elusimicrobia bacterium]|nr:GTP 3',8-cyclase MoaA [Elusimicrobiota bacterium]